MNKEFKVGQVWKTRGGNKAVIVAVTFTGLVVAVTSQKDTWGIFNFHDSGIFKYGKEDSYDLIEPWVEPEIIETKIYVIKMYNKIYFRDTSYIGGADKVLDTIKIKYTEGKGAEIVK